MSQKGFYSSWHELPHSQFVHWLFLLVIAGYLATGLVRATQMTLVVQVSNQVAQVAAAQTATINQQILKLPELTRTTIDKIEQLKVATSSAEREQLIKGLRVVIRQRSTALRQAARKNPRAVLQNVIAPELLVGLPDGLKTLLEKKVRLKGKFTHAIGEDFQNKVAENLYAITPDSATTTVDIHFTGQAPSLKTGDEISVDGVRIDDVAVVDNSPTSQGTIKLFAAAKVIEPSLLLAQVGGATTPTTVKKLVVLLVNFPGMTNLSGLPTADTIRTKIFSQPNSVRDYYRKISAGKWDIQGKVRPDGDVYGWFTIAADTSLGCNYWSWAGTADAAAKAAGIDLSGYTNRLYILNTTACSSWGGVASVGGDHAWLSGLTLWSDQTVGITTHELGHNFGMLHANLYSCSENGVAVPMDTSANCVSQQYGDYFDVMGGNSQGSYQMDATHMGQAALTGTGWFTSANTQTIDRAASSDGTYTLLPLEQPSSGVQSLRVKRDNGTYYYIEYRQPLGLDAPHTIYLGLNGVFIHLSTDYLTPSETNLILPHPEKTTLFDKAILKPGETFTDKNSGISITTVSQGTTGAKIRVTVNGVPIPPPGCPQTIPTLSLSPTTQSSQGGNALTYHYLLANTNPAGCPALSVNLAAATPTGWSATPTPLPGETIASGASVSRPLTISAPATAQSASYPIILTATNAVNSTVKTTAQATYVISPAISNGIPKVVISKPQANLILVGPVPLAINSGATSAVGISKIVIMVDNQLIKTCLDGTPSLSNTCNTSQAVSALASGNHLITVTATDKNSQTGSANLAFSKPVDVIRPTIGIVKPLTGFQLPATGSVSISATGTDAWGIKDIKISLDGKVIKDCLNGGVPLKDTCSVGPTITGLSVGSHLIEAVATDGNGNTSSAQVTVKK